MGGQAVGGPSLAGAVGRLVLGLVVLALVVLLGAGWYFADQLTGPPTVRPFEQDTTVVAVDEGTVTLTTTPDLATGGTWGLQLEDGGHVRLGAPVEVGPDEVVVEVLGTTDGPPAVGTAARVDEYWRVGDPAAVDVAFEDVTVPGPDGDLPAWWAGDGEAGTVVYVHGRGGTREEGLRFLPALDDAGWRTLLVTYRGDEGAPRADGDRTRFGTAEWADVDAALDWVVDRVGADRPVVLFGSSMGGAVVGQVLDRSPQADLVNGVVLDSAVLSLDRTLDLQADLNGVPEVVEPALLPVAQAWADLLHGLDSGSLEQVADDGTFDVPVLLFHGARDDFVPFDQTLGLAEVLGDRATYVGVEGARHVRSWNVDRARYESELRSFLEAL